jgi:outer membrane protein assembly factor BamB
MNDRQQLVAMLSVATAIVLANPGRLHADNWPQWRGPYFNGSSKETGLPAQFSRTENVRWTADLPGSSAATPVIWGDRVFVSSVHAQAGTLLAICLDRTTGKERWRYQAGTGIGQDDRSNYASPSPVTDGKLVWFFYGNGELIALDFDGKKVWSRNLQKDYGQFAFLWTFSTSPLLHEGRLYLQVLQRDVPVNGRGRADGPNESYLLALEPETGKELWRRVRPSDAVQESREAFTTPVPFVHDSRAEILVAGGDCITGHDSATGRELWRWGTWNPGRIGHWRLVPSPVAGGGVVLACAPKGSPVYSVKAGGDGALTESDLAWVSPDREISSDVSTPLFYQGLFYILNSDKRTLSSVEPATGKVLWTGSLESKAKIEASPTGADNKIYMMNHRGDVFVVQAGDQFKVLHTTSMGEADDKDLRSSIAVSQGNLFIRTGKKLYCIGRKT